MSTKEWVYQSEQGFGLYQEMTLEKNNDNPAIIEIANPVDFRVNYTTNADGEAFGKLMAEIPADVFDEIAVVWCKQRKLQGAFGGPVGNEWGSPDCDYE